jgi:hypothetical protein
MTRLDVKSTDFPETIFSASMRKEDLPEIEVWDVAFNMLKEMMYEKHTGISYHRERMKKLENKND